MVNRSRDAAWRRPAPGQEPQLPAGEAPADTLIVEDAEEAPHRPVPGDDDHGSPLSPPWLILAAGAVMGAILTIAVYSTAVGGGSGTNQFAFGGAGPGQGGGQGAPNQGFQPQGQGQPGQGQAQPGAAAQQGALAQANVLPRAPDFTGVVRSLAGNSLTVDTPQGTRVIQVSGQTQVFRSDGTQGSMADVSRGSTVAIVVSTDPVDRVLRADAIGLLGR